MADLTDAKRPASTLNRMFLGALIPVSTFLGIELMIVGLGIGIMGGMIFFMLVFLPLGTVMIFSGPVLLGIAYVPWRRALVVGIVATIAGIIVFSIIQVLASSYMYSTSTGFGHLRILPFSVACAVCVVDLATRTANDRKSIIGPLIGLIVASISIFVYEAILIFNTTSFSESIEAFEQPLFIFISIAAATIYIFISDTLSRSNTRSSFLATAFLGIINLLVFISVIYTGSINRSDPETTTMYGRKIQPKCGTIVTLKNEESWDFIATKHSFRSSYSRILTGKEVATGIIPIAEGTIQELLIDKKPVTLLSNNFRDSIGTKEFGEFRLVYLEYHTDCQLLIATPEQIQIIESQ